MMLTANFRAAEFDVHEPWPLGVGYAAKRLALAERLQWLRDLAGVPMLITSAWRSAARNAEIGGSATSQHMQGEAVDTVAWLVPIRTLAARVLASVRAGQAPAFGQIIFYPNEGHVHVSLPTLGQRNGEVRYKDATGRYPFLTSANALPVWSAAQRRGGLWLGALALAALAFAVLIHFNRSGSRV